MAARSPRHGCDPDEIADAIVTANRVLMQVSVEALGMFAPDLNLTEFRTLTLLERDGPQRLIDVATALDVTSTTATRLADHLAELGLVERVRQSNDRREIHIAIAAPGHGLVSSVSSQRRRFVASMLQDYPERDQVAAVRLLDRLGQPATHTAMETA